MKLRKAKFKNIVARDQLSLKLPQSRTANIVVNELKDEILIYDLKTDKAYCLNQTSKIVYQACGDGLTFEELKKKYKYTDDLIYLALDKLKENDLLADEDYASPFAGMNRREVIRKVGLASMIALPVITGLMAPSAAHAASCPPPQGSTNVPSGCQVGDTTETSGICAQDVTFRNTTCSRFSSQCRSGRATTGTCANNTPSPGANEFTCVCA